MSSVVSIVACGPSAIECGAEHAPGYVLAVNDACLHVRHDAVVSMDGRWSVNRVREILYNESQIWLRDRAWAKVDYPFKPATVRTFSVDTKSHVLGNTTDLLVGLNSGAVALNLAALMHPDRIYLYGFDAAFAGEKSHFFGDYDWAGQGDKLFPKKFRLWQAQMNAFAPQLKVLGIRVINTNKVSAIRSFEFGKP